MMDDGHQHLHIGCFANQQNPLLSLNLPASTSIYQHLPAFGEGASPASSSASGMPSNGQRVGIPWNTWIRRAQLGQLGQYSD